MFSIKTIPQYAAILLTVSLAACSDSDSSKAACSFGDANCGSKTTSTDDSTTTPPGDNSGGSGSTDDTGSILNPDNCTAEELDILGSAPDFNRLITGNVTYDRVLQKADGSLDYTNIQAVPASGASIHAVTCDGKVLEQDGRGLGVVFSDGYYEVRVPENVGITLSIAATSTQHLKATITTDKNAQTTEDIQHSYTIEVVDNTNEDKVYSYEPDISIPPSTVHVNDVDIHIASGWDAASESYTGERSSAPFAVLHVAEAIVSSWTQIIGDNLPTYAEDIIEGVGKRGEPLDLAKVTLAWSANNKPTLGSVESGAIGASHFADGKVYLLGQENVNTDEFDVDVIARNLVHLLTKNASAPDVADFGGLYNFSSAGLTNFLTASYGINEFSAKLDPRLAFREGFAIGFATGARTNSDGFYRDSRGLQVGSSESIAIDIENATPANISNSGWSNQLSIAAAVYDLLDTAAFDDSTPAVDDDGISILSYELIDAVKESSYTVALTTVFSFYSALKRTVFDEYSQIPNSAVEMTAGQKTSIDTVMANHGIFFVSEVDDIINEGNPDPDNKLGLVDSSTTPGAYAYDGATATIFKQLGKFGTPSADRTATVNVCSENTNGLNYYLDNRQYVIFSVIDQEHDDTISVEDTRPDIDIDIVKTSGVQNARIALALYKQGVLVKTDAGYFDGSVNTFQASEPLEPGGYTLEITHFGNLDLPINAETTTVESGQVCYDVTVYDHLNETIQP